MCDIKPKKKKNRKQTGSQRTSISDVNKLSRVQITCAHTFLMDEQQRALFVEKRTCRQRRMFAPFRLHCFTLCCVACQILCAINYIFGLARRPKHVKKINSTISIFLLFLSIRAFGLVQASVLPQRTGDASNWFSCSLFRLIHTANRECESITFAHPANRFDC